MVLGEPQILGQFKNAVRSAEAAGTLGWLLNKLFQRTFSVAKTVRSETDIGTSTVSMASAAVRLAESIYPSITEQSVLFIGAGEMIDLTATHFAAHHPRRMTFANRTAARSQQLADRFFGHVIPLNDLAAQLALYDIVVCCTASPLPIIGKGLTESALKARKHRPMLMFDLAVPRDIEAGVADLSNVYLYTIDDLDKVIQEGQGNREAAAVLADRLVDEEIARYACIQRSKEVVPVIAALREQSQKVCNEVNTQAMRRIAHGDSAEDAVAYATAALMKKLLHKPSVTLRKAGEASDQQLIDAARKLFDIGDT